MCLQPGLLGLETGLVGSVHGLSMVKLVLDVVQLVVYPHVVEVRQTWRWVEVRLVWQMLRHGLCRREGGRSMLDRLSRSMVRRQV